MPYRGLSPQPVLEISTECLPAPNAIDFLRQHPVRRRGASSTNAIKVAVNCLFIIIPFVVYIWLDTVFLFLLYCYSLFMAFYRPYSLSKRKIFQMYSYILLTVVYHSSCKYHKKIITYLSYGVTTTVTGELSLPAAFNAVTA